MVRFIQQTVALVVVALASTRDRLGSAAVTTIGIGSAVGVLISTLSIGSGIEMMAMKNVRADRAIARTAGERITELSREAVQLVESLPGVKRDVDGKPLVSADAMVIAQVRRKDDGSKAGVTMVGVGPKYATVYPELSIVAGRAFRAGINELVVGRNAQQSYRNLEVGKQLVYQGVTWTVVGVFEADAGLAESWLLTDAETLRAAFNRAGYAQMTVMLDSPEAFSELSTALRSIPTSNVELKPEVAIRRQESRDLSGIVNFVSYFLGSIMAVGAMMGALNSMYTTVDARRRDFATLRVLGFARSAIAVAVIIEALILAVPGAIAGVLVPWLLFNGDAVTFVGLNFSLVVTVQLAELGFACALLIGAFGGSVPVFGAMRVSIATGLRAA